MCPRPSSAPSRAQRARFAPLLGAVLMSASLAAPAPLRAQATATFEPELARAFDFPLTIREIMRGPEVLGEAPAAVAWTDDSRWIYFTWKPGGGTWDAPRSLYRIPAGGGEPERIPAEQADSVGILFASGALSPDRRWRVSAREGDLHLVDRRTMAVRPLVRTREVASQPLFSADGRSVLYRQGMNIFRISLEAGGVEQLTDLRPGPEPEDSADPQGHRAFLEEQQRELFEHIRVREAREEREREARERREAARPAPTWLARGETVGALVPTRDGRYVAVSANRPAAGTRNSSIPFWITESGYTEPRDFRTKVGDGQTVSRIGIVAVATGETTWLNAIDAVEGTPGLAERRVEGEPEFSALTFLGWNDAGTVGLVAATSYGYNHRWLWSVEAATGALTLVDRLEDEAWIAGPCGFGCAGFIPGSDRIYFAGEETGFAHLYVVEPDGSGRRALTSGEWEVLSVDIPEDRSHFLLRTNEGSPFSQHVWLMDFDGGDRTRITAGEGQFEMTPSPDGRRMAVVHSTANRPGELFVAPLRAGAALDQVTVSPTAEWLTYPWIQPEIVRFTARDGVEVPARIYRPSDVGASPNGAAVLFVHGAGYLQNVHNWWSSYSREYMFHHFLASQGYTVLDIDYRGSAGYGRDWRTAIYRHMGGKDLSDHTDGVRWLVANEGIDPQRIGIYGGSYGGFITLMALFTEPDVFQAGGALRSVTDWAHYNHNYTARILNQPKEDEEAYRRSSPIYFAENFRGHLLMAHGMVDVNVHFSDVVRLSQRLIELGKENWEMAIYPVEDHGFVEPSSWTDEYRRIYELFRRVIGGGGPG